jgi:hypothetical protein
VFFGVFGWVWPEMKNVAGDGLPRMVGGQLGHGQTQSWVCRDPVAGSAVAGESCRRQ